MNKAFRFRFYPNQSQEILITKTFGSCRFIYNQMLHDKIEAYQTDKINLQTTPSQYKGKYEWLKEVDSYALCNEQIHLQTAYKNFFRDPKTGFPKYKSKKHDKKTYTTNNVNGVIRIDDKHHIHLPKLGWVNFVEHRQIPDNYKIKSATITQKASGKYYISVLTEYEFTPPEIELNSNNSLGLDYSSPEFYVDDQGNRANYPKFFRVYEDKLTKEQRKLSHMKFGSNNYLKQRKRVAKIREKIADSRNDFLHKLSYSLAEQYDYIFVEDIDMKTMSKSLNLGKATMDNGFGKFRIYLNYKMEERGKQIIKIGRFDPTSIVCSNCGAYHKDIVNSLDVREWFCPDCNTHHDRDVNAAKNIKKIGLTLI